mgnify:FL=1
MKIYEFEAKTYEEAVNKAINELNTPQENLIIKILEEKNGLLKKSTKIEVIKHNDLVNYVKEVLNDITSNMGIEANLEIRKRDNNLMIKIFSNHNAVLIGKNGCTIQALQNVIRQIVYNAVENNNLLITLDVENYKEKRVSNIERLAKRIAKEVLATKTEAKLDSMNSYERRIVHAILADNPHLTTESIGEEPNRCVVIKYVEE